MSYYKDLREFIQVLEQHGRLVRIKREINKDTHLMPLVRWQFRGLPQKDRKAFLFENVTDAKGKKYNCPNLVGSHAASREIYALAMNCAIKDIAQKWEEAQLHPIKPVMVASGPAQEEVHMGDKLLEHGGLEEFAIPISTPGFDSAPYFSAGNVISKDPDTGIRNVGNYGSMVKSPTRVGVKCRLPKHLRQHWQKCKDKGLSSIPVAIAVGVIPNIGLVAVIDVPYGVDEFDVAGGIAGEPVELVKCKTVDLEVPATAEIVIEGEIPTGYLEQQGPFGEYTGSIGMANINLFMNVTCITHRKRPIWNSYISQYPPSESSLITEIGMEASHYRLLKHDLGIDNVIDVGFHEESGGRQLCVVSMKKPTTPQVWQALYGITAASPNYSKLVIAVDDDIDPRDLDSVADALCYRMQPHRDIQIAKNKIASLDPSAISFEERGKSPVRPITSAILIDATRKWNYPPVALPKKAFMEEAKNIWEAEGLPQLSPKVPWYGISLGYWPDEFVESAELAVQGDYFKTGEKLTKNRVKT